MVDQRHVVDVPVERERGESVEIAQPEGDARTQVERAKGERGEHPAHDHREEPVEVDRGPRLTGSGHQQAQRRVIERHARPPVGDLGSERHSEVAEVEAVLGGGLRQGREEEAVPRVAERHLHPPLPQAEGEHERGGDGRGHARVVEGRLQLHASPSFPRTGRRRRRGGGRPPDLSPSGSPEGSTVGLRWAAPRRTRDGHAAPEPDHHRGRRARPQPRHAARGGLRRRRLRQAHRRRRERPQQPHPLQRRHRRPRRRARWRRCARRGRCRRSSAPSP